MGGQFREKPDYEPINPVKKVEILENYRDKKKIYFISPFANTYIGYMDDDFFGFTVDEKDRHLWLMECKDAVDYYMDKIFFHNPVLEYDTFYRKEVYRIYINALKMVKEQNDR